METGPGPLDAALSAVGDRWTLLLVEALLPGPARFADLQAALPGIAPTVLSQRLRQLEERSLVVATPYSERPLRYVYELAAPARELAAPLRLLADWAVRHRDAEPLRHVACGTALEATLWCPTCEAPVADDATSDLHWA